MPKCGWKFRKAAEFDTYPPTLCREKLIYLLEVTRRYYIGVVYIWLWTSHKSLLQKNYTHSDMECLENIVKTFFSENLYMLVSLCNCYVHLLLSTLNCKGVPTEL